MYPSSILSISIIFGSHCIAYGAIRAFTGRVFGFPEVYASVWVYSVSAVAAICALLNMLGETLPFTPTRSLLSLALKLDLFIMVLSVWVLVPVCMARLIVYRWHKRKKTLGLAIVIATWIAMSIGFAQLGTLVNVPRASLKFSHVVARIAMGGVFIGSVLTGFGSIQFPLENLRMLFTSVSRTAIANLEKRILAILKTRRAHSRHIASLTSQYRLELPRTPESRSHIPRGYTFETISNKPSIFFRDEESSFGADGPGSDVTSDEDQTWLSPEPSTITRSAGTAPPVRQHERSRAMSEVLKLQEEISSLDSLATELMTTLNEMRETRALYLRSQTPHGKIMNVLAWTMVGACIYRVTTAVINVTFRRTPEIDPATNMINVILGFVHVDLDVEYWSALLSLFYVGFIVYSTISGFSEKIRFLVETASERIGKEFLILGITEIQTLYFCACALLLRANLPAQCRKVITEVLGADLDFGEFYLQADFVFIFSSIFSVVYAAFNVRSRTWKTRKGI